MKKQILITGGGGFLGKNLQRYIKKHKLNKIYNFLFPSSKEFNCLDLTNMHQYVESKIDVIVHMAAKCGGILANKNSPADFIRDNTQMALNIYEFARHQEVKTVYSLGSVCSYPLNCPIPFKEKDLWNGAAEPTNFPYGQSKRTLLMLGQTYREQYGIGGAHLIPANMMGEFDNFDLTTSHVIPALIHKFINAKEKNLPEVNVWGDGSASREFLFAEDCCEAIIKSIQIELNERDPINIGNGKEVVISDLAELIKTLVGFEGSIVYTGEVSNGQPRRCLDVSGAEKLLGWKAKTPLTDSLSKVINYYNLSKV